MCYISYILFLSIIGINFLIPGEENPLHFQLPDISRTQAATKSFILQFSSGKEKLYTFFLFFLERKISPFSSAYIPCGKMSGRYLHQRRRRRRNQKKKKEQNPSENFVQGGKKKKLRNIKINLTKDSRKEREKRKCLLRRHWNLPLPASGDRCDVYETAVRLFFHPKPSFFPRNLKLWLNQ